MSIEISQTMLIFLVSSAFGVMIAVTLAAWSSYRSFTRTEIKTEKKAPVCSKCRQSMDLDVPTFIRRGIKIELD